MTTHTPGQHLVRLRGNSLGTDSQAALCPEYFSFSSPESRFSAALIKAPAGFSGLRSVHSRSSFSWSCRLFDEVVMTSSIFSSLVVCGHNIQAGLGNNELSSSLSLGPVSDHCAQLMAQHRFINGRTDGWRGRRFGMRPRLRETWRLCRFHTVLRTDQISASGGRKSRFRLEPLERCSWKTSKFSSM